MSSFTNDPIETFVKMSEAQYQALKRKHTQQDQDTDLETFVLSAQPTIGCNDAITVYWSGMWLCIELDGYTHS